MKILAIVPNKSGYGDHDFLCQVSADDLSRLLGHSSYYSLKDKRKKLEIGDTIKVEEMFTRLREMKEKEASLEKSAALLRASADLLEKALPAVHRANNKEKSEQAESE